MYLCIWGGPVPVQVVILYLKRSDVRTSEHVFVYLGVARAGAFVYLEPCLLLRVCFDFALHLPCILSCDCLAFALLVALPVALLLPCVYAAFALRLPCVLPYVCVAFARGCQVRQKGLFHVYRKTCQI